MKTKLLILIFTQIAFSQVPSIQWQKCIGGNGNDFIQSVFQTLDDGYIVAGYTTSTDGSAIGNHGSEDILIVKLNSAGNIQWNKVFGGTSNDRVNKIIQSTDGGFIFSGFTASNDGDVSGNHGSLDVWVVKLNSAGDLIWQKTYGGSNQDHAYDIIEVTDGFIVAALTSSNNGNVTGNHGTTDAWIIKIDFIGNLIWQKTFGGSKFDSAVGIQQTSDGGFIFTGSTNSNNGNVIGSHSTTSFDYWVVKISNLGIFQWQKCLGGSNNDEATSVQQANDGGFVVSGYTSSTDGDVIGFLGFKDYWIVKLNSTGNILWKKTFGGTQEDYALKIKKTNNDGFIITGITLSNDGSVLFNHATSIATLDIWIVKLDTNGNEIWQKSLGNNGYQDSFDIQQTADGGYIVAGNTGGGNVGDVTGFIGGNSDFWVVKLGPDNLNNLTFDKTNVVIYPNPTEDFIVVKNLNEDLNNVSVIDSQGRKMNFISIEGKIDLTNLISGIYILEFKTNQNIMVRRKIIKK